MRPTSPGIGFRLGGLCRRQEFAVVPSMAKIAKPGGYRFREAVGQLVVQAKSEGHATNRGQRNIVTRYVNAPEAIYFLEGCQTVGLSVGAVETLIGEISD